MRSVYDIHLFRLYPADSGLDDVQWLCRDCARKRHAHIQKQYAVNGSEVCEQCGCKQTAFLFGAWVERKRTQHGTRTRVGRVVGVGYNGHLDIDWIDPNRIGGDGWYRSSLTFKAVKLASEELCSKANRYVELRSR